MQSKTGSLNYEIIHEKKNWTHEIPTRRNFGPTKYPRENILDPQNTHEGKYVGMMVLDTQDPSWYANQEI